MNFVDVIRSVSIIQFLIVGLFLITHKNGNTTANKLLAFFLIAKAICYIGDYVYLNFTYVIEKAPFLFALSPGLDLLLGPPLYLYCLSLAYKDFKLKKYHSLHAVPFILYVVYYAIVFEFYYSHTIRNFILTDFTYSPIAIIINSAIYFHFITYSILCLYTLKKYNENLKAEFSSLEKKKLKWLKFLVAGFILIWIGGYYNFLSFILKLSFVIPWELITSLIFIFANVIVFLGLKQPELFSGIVQRDSGPKYAKTPLPEGTKDEYLEKLLDYMKSEKPYLNPTLTITEVSERISIPARYLSQVINTSLNQNFYDFVNSYRIEECKYYFQNNSNDTVLEVLYEVGFNSKSSFNRAFKKYTGMTPSEFKRQQDISFAK